MNVIHHSLHEMHRCTHASRTLHAVRIHNNCHPSIYYAHHPSTTSHLYVLYPYSFGSLSLYNSRRFK